MAFNVHCRKITKISTEQFFHDVSWEMGGGVMQFWWPRNRLNCDEIGVSIVETYLRKPNEKNLKMYVKVLQLKTFDEKSIIKAITSVDCDEHRGKLYGTFIDITGKSGWNFIQANRRRSYRNIYDRHFNVRATVESDIQEASAPDFEPEPSAPEF